MPATRKVPQQLLLSRKRVKPFPGLPYRGPRFSGPLPQAASFRFRSAPLPISAATATATAATTAAAAAAAANAGGLEFPAESPLADRRCRFAVAPARCPLLVDRHRLHWPHRTGPSFRGKKMVQGLGFSSIPLSLSRIPEAITSNQNPKP